MTFDEFSTICDKLTGITNYLYLHVMGEPTLHENICDFISHATERGFKVAITTNGTFLADVGEELISSGVYKVNISLHSFEGDADEKHTKYIKSCLDFADSASKNGVLTVLRLWNGGASDTNNDETLRIMHEKFEGKWHMGARGARIRDKLHLEYGERFIWPDISNENIGDDLFCHGLGDHFGILCDGSVIPCCLDSEGEITLGNIFDNDISGILSNSRANKIKEGFSNKKAVEELCQKCPYARRFKI